MRKFVANADDFGSHELINAAVKKAFAHGICRSASLMAGGEAFDDAVKIARSLPGFGTGIHFTLVMGNPVLPPSEIPSLVNSSGKFHEDFSVFVRHYSSGRIRLDEVRSELSAQLARIQNTGLHITHSDSQQHIHTLPAILNVVLEFSESAGIKAVRMPCLKGVSLSVWKIGLKTLANIGKFRAAKRGFTVPDNFAGFVGNGTMNESELLRIIDTLSDGTTEIMTHPGTDNKILQEFSKWPHDFEAELSALTSQAVIDRMNQRGIKAANFSQL